MKNPPPPNHRPRLLLVRHGQTNDNKRGVFQGQEGSTLNERGREQARKLGARLQGLPIAGVYTSDLSRARETAELIGAAVGVSPVDDHDLREIFVGTWQGKTFAEIEAAFPDDWAAWRRGDVELRRGGGETYGELAARMTRAMHKAADATRDGTAIVVSHGAAIKTFVGTLLGLVPGSLAWLGAIRVPDNTAVSVVERDREGIFRLLVLSDCAHLGDSVRDAASGPPR